MESTVIEESIDLESSSYVRVIADHRSFLLETALVVELANTNGIVMTPVPGGRDEMVGILNHRGRVVPVFDLRSFVGAKTRQEETSELRNFLAAREQDHVAWLEELKTSVATGSRFTKALDPTQCAFGKWYEGIREQNDERRKLTNDNATIDRILNQLDEPHKQIHGIAARVLELAEAGDIAEANHIIESTWNTELATMKRLFANLFEIYESMVGGRIVLISLEGNGVGLLVDGVHSVIDFAIEQAETESEDGLVTVLLPDGTLAFPILEATLLSMFGADMAA